MSRILALASATALIAAALSVLPAMAAEGPPGGRPPPDPRTNLEVVPLAAGEGAFTQPGSEASKRPPVNYPASEAYYNALKAAAGGGSKMTADKLPDWTGIWTAAGAVTFDPAGRGRKPYGPLTASNAAFVDKVNKDVAAGVEWDPLSYCLPAGFPRSLSEPFLREFIVKPDEVWIANEMVNEIRRVYVGKEHPPEDELWPMWEGHSIGFWDGDKLVVHTKSGRAGDYMRSGPRYSAKLSAVEIFRKVSADLIEDDITVYDPVELTRPWRVVRQFTRVTEPGSRIDTWSCEENNNTVNQAGVTNFVLPGEAGYKHPDEPDKAINAPKK